MKILLPLVALAISITGLIAAPEPGKPAPEFTLKDASGKAHTLSSLKGKTVVLEWVNYECPFVKKHYESGNMQKLQKAATAKDVVWLSICSSGPGKQGHFTAEEIEAKGKSLNTSYSSYLIDEDGAVGKLYNAKTTPEIFVINPEGNIVYMGAIDDKASPDPSTLASAKNFLTAALDETLAGKSVSTPSTKSYGCSVKY